MNIRRTYMNRLIALLTIIMMGVGSAMAADIVTPTTGESKWTDSTVGMTGSGTSADPYVITTKSQLAYLGWVMCNKKAGYQSGLCFKLGNDIDLGGDTWIYGKHNNQFQGTFDGNNKTISNFKIDVNAQNTSYAFFGAIGNSDTQKATIKDVTFDKVTVSSSTNITANDTRIAVAVGYVNKNSEVNNVKVTNSHVTFSNDITGGNVFIGLVVGRVEGNGTDKVPAVLTNLAVSNSDIKETKASERKGAHYIGGIVGHIKTYTALSNSSISKVEITTNASANNATYYAGGIVGYVESLATTVSSTTVSDVKINMEGNITGGTPRIGGLIAYNKGMLDGLTATDCNIKLGASTANTTAVDVTAAIGIGYCDQDDAVLKNIIVKNNTGTSSITYNYTCSAGKSLNIGGVVGYLTEKNITLSNPTLSKSGIYVNGVYSGGGEYRVGGIAGYYQAKKESSNFSVDGSEIVVSPSLARPLRAGWGIGHADKLAIINGAKISDSKITLSEGTASDLYIGGFVGNLSTSGSSLKGTIEVDSCEIKVTENITAGTTYAGLLAGNLAASVNKAVVSGGKLDFGGSLNTSYVGGVIGNYSGSATAPSKIKELTASTSPLLIKKILVKDCYIGGVFGRINTYSVIEKADVTLSSLTYNVEGNPNVALNLGTFAGGIIGKADLKTEVKNVTVSKSEMVIGTGTQNVSQIKAGIIGQVNTNVLLDTWKVTGDSKVTVNGNLTTSTSYLGGFIGRADGAASAPLTIKNVTFEKTSTVSVSGVTKDAASYLGGLIGYIISGDAANTDVTIDNVEVKGVSTVSIAGVIGNDVPNAKGGYDRKGDVYVGGFAGLVQGRAKADNKMVVSHVTLGDVKINIPEEVHAGSRFGGLIGYVNTSCQLNTLSLENSTLTFNGDITALSYVGGAIGSLDGAAGYPSSATGFDVKGLDINLNGNLTNGLYVGGIAGQLNAVDKTNRIEKSSVSGKIRTTGSHTFVRNKTYAFGGIVGYTAQSITTFSEINNCVSEVDFNLSGYTPSDVSGSNFNLQQNGFVIGGVIGRINTPSRLPESLFFTGKINAPFATVAPVVGVFNTSIGDAKYLYDDYVGANAAYLTTAEWEKASSWYYNNYKIGLSQALLDETARTKNYASASVVTEDGIKYINVKDDTFSKSNVINSIDKSSYTVLAYNQTGKDVDFGIFPAWNTNATTYPAYYMYYMQGVNRGQYVSDAIEQLKKDILEGMGALIDLVFVDNNGDVTIAANRGVVDHNMKVTPSGEVDSYKWYVDGNLQSETSDAFTYHPSPKGNDILVEAYKDGECCKRVHYTIKSVLRVKDVSAAVYGTKVNPYLIGNAEELQLLSYLSSLPATIAWDTKGYKSKDHYNRAYYELDNDIDMSSVADFTPISFPSANSTDGDHGGYNQNIVFEGVFDGKFHTIKNLRETWHSGSFDINDMNVGWGLFSYVGNSTKNDKVGDAKDSKLPAKICNLFIDGAVLTHKANNTSFAYNGTAVANNCMVGVLAGIVSSNTIVENIEIRNSKITDGGSWEYSLASKGLYVGGAIGSMQKALNATGDSPVNSKVDHVAANVDISLNNAAFADNGAVEQLGQFNVGGIVGRYVATGHNQTQVQPSLPAYVFYSGDITAPKAWISPVLAALRYKDNNAVNIFANYSKQWEGNNNTEVTQIAITNAHYYNFKIEGKKVTDFYPENQCTWGARSITAHADGNGTKETYTAKMFQGVNYGAIWVDAVGGSLKTLNENKVDDTYWTWKDGFVHMTKTPCIDAYLTSVEDTEGTGVELTANMSDESTGTYRWQESFDGASWIDLDGEISQMYATAYVNMPKLVVAYVKVGGKEYRTQPFMVHSIIMPFSPYLESEGVDKNGDGEDDNFRFDVKWKDDVVPNSSYEVTYQWCKSDGLTPIEGKTSSTLKLDKDGLDEAGGSVWCVIRINYMGREILKFSIRSYIDATVVFVDGTNGKDNAAGSRERGWTPETAVKTIDHANSLLKSADDGGTWDNNIIVIMGTLNPTDFRFQSNGTNPATLTGKWNGTDYNGVIKIEEIKPTAGEHTLNLFRTIGSGTNCYVLGDTKFENLTFYGNNGGNCFIELHGRDVTFGKGLVMKNFKNLSKAHGNMGESEKIPELTIVFTATNLSKEEIDLMVNRSTPQVVTFQSGHYGRILSGRFTQYFFWGNYDGTKKYFDQNTSYSILGSATRPVWAVVNVDIDNENEMTDGGSVTYTRDINAIIAGLTDGSMYGDFEVNFHGGNISYIVGANQGNAMRNGEVTYTPKDGEEGTFGQWPNASFFGRSVINVEQDPKLKSINIGHLYAGGLGRDVQAASTSRAPVDMYLYGRTEVNIKSGTISGNVYGGGTGGVIGVNPWDDHMPYATKEANDGAKAIIDGVQYGYNPAWSSMTKESPLAKVVLHNRKATGDGYEIDSLDLSNSSTTLNISGGTINGNVYGGGYGEVPDMPILSAMQGIGSVFGTSNITITGGTIDGSVYGGSRGSTMYYKAGKNAYGQTITHVAEMNGTVNLKISGDEFNYPTIGGNIYGAGQGLEAGQRTATQDDVDAGNATKVGDMIDDDFLRIATTGNKDLLGEDHETNVNIEIDLPENAPFNGNIYGGGEFGVVDGNTNIVIKRGTFNGNIFGGGKGKNNEANRNKAKISGSTNVKIGE